MSVTTIAPDLESPPPPSSRVVNLTGTSTPLAARLGEIEVAWLLTYLSDRYTACRGALADWRAQMQRWKQYSDEDYSFRVGEVNKNRPRSKKKDVFSKSNDTLGLAAGFWNYFDAQARNDIFGTAPWLGAQPEGRSDEKLADLITKHANYKLSRSNIEEVAKDAINMAGWGGTAFIKARWRRDPETYQQSVRAAFSKAAGDFLRDESGNLIEDETKIPEGTDGRTIEWRVTGVEKTVMVYDNLSCSLILPEDIAFDPKAQELDLYYTPVFVRFRAGLLDVAAEYGIPKEKIEDLKSATPGGDEDTGVGADGSIGIFGTEDNPMVSLVEGMVRCDPFQTGRPIRLHVVFDPRSMVLYRVDYLAEVTPAGLLPVFPVRIHKKAGQIFGAGYFEKYETVSTSVDRQYNTVQVRNAESATVWTGLNPEALKDPNTIKESVNPEKPFILNHGKTIADLIGFATAPDVNQRSVELLNMPMQMAQMRSGITSAAQGELKGVPNASTATGVRDLTSRGAILLKCQIDEVARDVTDLAEFAVHLLYANQDADETFTWGEGDAAELLELKAGDVQGLRMNVTLKLVQAQNAAKLEAARTAIEIVSAYLSTPEPEKPSVRPIYIQALSSLGFQNADQIIRVAATDPAALLELMGPELSSVVRPALEAAGYLAPEGGSTAENSAAPPASPEAPTL